MVILFGHSPWWSGLYFDVRTNAGIQFPAGNVQSGLHSNHNDSNWELDHVYYRPIQKYVNGNWYTVDQYNDNTN